ncbi:chap [Oceanicola sp. 22II-s10i]|nr:chap [Oceanicola sp. 22II-s10i]
MTRVSTATLKKLCLLGSLILTTAACAPRHDSAGLDPERVSRAVQTATDLRESGYKVWCVPFARDASGIDIRGNANTWWSQASSKGYDRGQEPKVGSVMAFSSTGSLPRGHVAVVSKLISEREILVDHANWAPSQVSLGMYVRDVSDRNDWSAVRLESQPNALGSVYPIQGFISTRGR